MNKTATLLFLCFMFLTYGCVVSEKQSSDAALSEHIIALSEFQKIQNKVEQDLTLPDAILLDTSFLLSDKGIFTSDCIIGTAAYLYEHETQRKPKASGDVYYDRIVFNDVVEGYKTITVQSPDWEINSIHTGILDYQTLSFYMDLKKEKDNVTVLISGNYLDVLAPDSFPNLDYWPFPGDGSIYYMVKVFYLYPSKNMCM